MLSGAWEDIKDKLAYKICWCELPIKRTDGMLDLTFAKTASISLAKNLDGCDSVIIFAATLGIELDRAIARYSRLSPAKALLLDAIGTERAEALCDAFCEEINTQKETRGLTVRPRFSPGYGDLPIEMQRDIFALLESHKRIGLSLNESMLMSPSKSVTAIIGVCSKEKK
jgi:cobalamin-dependent methionine synthase I